MKFGIIVAAAILLLGASCNREADPQPTVAEIPKLETQIGLATLVDDPQFAWVSAMKRLYPAEYQVVGATMRAQVDEGASVMEARHAMMDALKPFMLQHKKALAIAPDSQLVEYLRRNAIVAERLLREDTKACTDVFHGSLSPMIKLPDATWRLMSDATAQLLVAAHHAETNPVPVRDTRLTSDDFRLWRVQMEGAGATTDTFALLSDPARKAAASDDEKCRVRVLMMRGALALPKKLAAKIALNVVATGS